MKQKILFFCLIISSLGVLQAQTPLGFQYQAVARDIDGNILSNTSITLRFQFLDGSPSGALTYEETHSLITNSFGLIQTVIGQGDVENGNFSQLDWAEKTYFLEVELNGLNHSGYAQTISQSVIGATGSTNEQLSHTVGEPIVFTGQTAGLVLTQGFHQPFATVVTGVETPPISTQVTFFPNPISGQITLQLETAGRFTLQIELMNLDGKQLAPLQVWEGFGVGQTSVDLGSLPDGIYLINLQDRKGRLLKAVKAMKAH